MNAIHTAQQVSPATLHKVIAASAIGPDGGALDAATDELARLGQVQAVSADIADEASVRAAFAQAGPASS